MVIRYKETITCSMTHSGNYSKGFFPEYSYYKCIYLKQIKLVKRCEQVYMYQLLHYAHFNL